MARSQKLQGNTITKFCLRRIATFMCDASARAHAKVKCIAKAHSTANKAKVAALLQLLSFKQAHNAKIALPAVLQHC